MKFLDERRIVPDILERLVNCIGLKNVYYIGNDFEIGKVCVAIEKKEIFKVSEASIDGLLYMDTESEFAWNELVKFCKAGNCVVKTSIEENIPENVNGITYIVNGGTDKETYKIVVMGPPFFYKKNERCDDFKVLAIIHSYNEADIIEETIQHLLDQGLYIYVLDNYSTDGSFDIVRKIQIENKDRIFLEKFPEEKYEGQHRYEWYKQLEKTEQIAQTLDFDWFIHYDVDEIRISPWKNVNLRDAICFIDSLGYNCVENTVIDFRLTRRDEVIFNTNGFYAMRENITTEQLKTWKKSERIELKSSAGHKAQISNPKIFPLKILNKHYPMRSVEQASKKVFDERKKDYSYDEKIKKGWHTQYDNIVDVSDFIYDSEKLLYWDEDSFEKNYLPLFTECGLRKEKKDEFGEIKPFIHGKKISIYGAGRFGDYAIRTLSKDNAIVDWYDQGFQIMPTKYGKKIKDPNSVCVDDVDYIAIALKGEKAKAEVKDFLLEMGIDDRKIIQLSSE